MKLLIVTQKADKGDTVLGFAHSWFEEFSKHAEHVTVIAQYVGEHALPANVTVHSLGKDKGKRPFAQILTFKKLIWDLRHEYDAVFVHMNPVWMAVGGPMWMLLRKPRFLWYESRGVTWILKMAVRFAKKVFSASPFGMPLPIAHSVVTGHGIDIARFTPDGPETRDKNLLLTVGRITKVKKFPEVLDVLRSLADTYRLRIVGKTVTAEDEGTLADLNERMRADGLTERVSFESRRPDEMPPLYRQARLFVHAASTAGVDKAVLEAMACGCIPVSCSPAFNAILPSSLCVSPDGLAAAARQALDLPPEQENALRASLIAEVREHHSLPRLITRIISEMNA